MATSPLKYLFEQLGIGFQEWKQLSAEDQATLRQWAAEEIAELGL